MSLGTARGWPWVAPKRQSAAAATVPPEPPSCPLTIRAGHLCSPQHQAATPFAQHRNSLFLAL